MNKKFEAGPVNSKIRLKDIAESAEISVAAVSMALSDHPSISEPTKMRVRQLAETMGYRPGVKGAGRPQNGGTIQSGRLGFVSIGRSWDGIGPRAELLQAFSRAARVQDVRVEFISVSEGDASSVAREILTFAKELDGVLITDLVKPEVLQRVAIGGACFVVYGYAIDDGGRANAEVGHFITGDDLRMGRESTHWFLAHGHERIGLVCEKLTPGLSHSRWMSGYQLALVESQRAIDPDLVFVTGEIEAGEDRAAEHFLSLREPPTAYIIPDGRIAGTFLREMEARGHAIAHENVMVECGDQVANAFGVQDCPACYVDLSKVAALAIHQLMDLADRPLEFSTETLVPFATRNWRRAGRV